MIYEPILQILLKGLPKVDQIKPLAAPELLEEKKTETLIEIIVSSGSIPL